MSIALLLLHHPCRAEQQPSPPCHRRVRWECPFSRRWHNSCVHTQREAGRSVVTAQRDYTSVWYE